VSESGERRRGAPQRQPLRGWRQRPTRSSRCPRRPKRHGGDL